MKTTAEAFGIAGKGISITAKGFSTAGKGISTAAEAFSNGAKGISTTAEAFDGDAKALSIAVEAVSAVSKVKKAGQPAQFPTISANYRKAAVVDRPDDLRINSIRFQHEPLPTLVNARTQASTF